MKCLLYVYCQVEADLARAQQEVKTQLSSQRPIDTVVYRVPSAFGDAVPANKRAGAVSVFSRDSFGGTISADASSVISAIQSMGGIAPGEAPGMFTT